MGGGDIAASIKQAVGECLAGMLYGEVSEDARRKIEKAIDGAVPSCEVTLAALKQYAKHSVKILWGQCREEG